jgi:metal-sulfur cluster biosynthetic enzyme
MTNKEKRDKKSALKQALRVLKTVLDPKIKQAPITGEPSL